MVVIIIIATPFNCNHLQKSGKIAAKMSLISQNRGESGSNYLVSGLQEKCFYIV
uniref:Uncharacterized protein n=1 Tax=Octopus bimaculoides TaxID=37653 RepID=A0A0L8I4M1_OCTBM